MTEIHTDGTLSLETGDKFMEITPSKVMIEHEITSINDENGEEVVKTVQGDGRKSKFEREGLEELLNKGAEYSGENGYKYRLTQ